jgi:hypothetical protein
MHPADQEHPVSGPLRQLPQPQAPPSLLPRVMTAVRAWSERPWYERAWFTWPVQGQIAAVAVLVLIAGGIVTVWPNVEASVATAVAPLRSAITDDVTETTEQAAVVTTVVWLVGRTFFTTVVPYASAMVLLMCLACGLFAMALNYVASGRTSER